MRKTILFIALTILSFQIKAISNGVYQILQVCSVENDKRTNWVKHEGNFVVSDDFITGETPNLGHFSLIIKDRKEYTDKQSGITGITIECSSPEQTNYLVTLDNGEGFTKLIMLDLSDPDNSVIIFKIKKIMDLPQL